MASQVVITCVLWLAAVSVQEPPVVAERTIYIRNSLPVSAYVWVNDDAIGPIAAKSTAKFKLKQPDDTDRALLVLASIANTGGVFGASISLDLSGEDAGIDCWYGGVRPPYQADRESAESITLSPAPPELYGLVVDALTERRDDKVSADHATDGTEVSQDATFSPIIIGSTHPVRSKHTNSIGMTLVEMFPGEFFMGCLPTEDGFTAPERQHVVWLTKPFFIGETEVTQAQWEAVMGNNPSQFQDANRPVETITWHQAMEFCEKLGEKEGRIYRLPTEAEWEYACRAGTTTAYSFGPSAYILHRRFINNFAWTNANSGGTTHPVRSRRPNRWGLYDMHGNVLEWCADWWSWRYPTQRMVNPTGPEVGTQKTARGGGWPHDPAIARSAARSAMPPAIAGHNVGFRVVLEES